MSINFYTFTIIYLLHILYPFKYTYKVSRLNIPHMFWTKVPKPGCSYLHPPTCKNQGCDQPLLPKTMIKEIS
jgi:hypothetical protein